MSIRYGISVIPEARFTARVYQARQIICGQYACWAAEMHPVHLPLVDYFACPEDKVAAVSAGLQAAVQDFVRYHRRAPLPAWELAAAAGQIYLDFAVKETYRPPAQWPVNLLRQAAIEQLQRIGGLPPLPEIDPDNPPLRLPLLQYANLPEPVFTAAADFAQGVLRELLLPYYTRLGQLTLLRFQSDAAGDDWSNGGWAADLRFQIIDTYSLS